MPRAAPDPHPTRRSTEGADLLPCFVRRTARPTMTGLQASCSASSRTARPAADAPCSADLDAALRTALVEAETVAGAYADTPVRFIALRGDCARTLKGLGPGGPGAWMLVACRNSAEVGHQVHLQERCLTAAQRFTLALWTEGVEAVWLQDGLPDQAAFRRAGVDLGPYAPLGAVWCPDAG